MTPTLTEAPADLRDDAISREIAFRMVLSPETWPGSQLAMKRMYRIETGWGIQTDYKMFGVIKEISLPIRIYVTTSRVEVDAPVMEFESIREMLKHGWTVD